MLSKTRLITITTVLAFLVGLQACAQKLSPQEGCNFIVNSQKQRVSWQHRAPVILYIDPSVHSDYFAGIQNAAQAWNRQLGREVLRIGGVLPQATTPSRDKRNVIYWSSTWDANQPYEQARTTVSWISDQIEDADVRINGKIKMSIANQPMRDHVDFESLMVHEFGHVLGLMHIERHDSVMVKALPDDHLRRQPSDFDISSAQCEY